MNPTTVIWVIAAAFAVAIIYSASVQKMHGAFVNALLDIDAIGEANAIDGSRLACPPSRSTEREITKRGMLSKVVGMTSEGRYYIIPEYRETARSIYAKESHLVLKTSLLLVATAILALAVSALWPVFVNALNELVGEKVI